MRTLKRLLLTTSMCCFIATANAAPIDDAEAAYLRGDYAQALKILRPLVAQGNARAQSNIGDLYFFGHGVTENYQEALKWYRLAADQGRSSAQYSIGWMYLKGYGVTQDYQEALKWFRLAAAQGQLDAIRILELPEMVAAAKNSPPDRRSASIKTGANAAPMDDALAAYNRGDYAQALKILRPLATKGNADAQYGMGALYYEGKGVTKETLNK